jgi:LPS sulfotransferase NodH
MKIFGRRDKQPTRPEQPAPSDPVAKRTFNPAPALSGAGFSRLRNCVVVYSNFRAGSHLLQSSLSAVTALRDADEIFARQTSDANSFNAFLETADADHHALLVEPESQLPGYFRYLFDQVAHDAPLIISLKYTQAHRLGADDMTAAPLILKVLADYRVPVLHLVRRDVVQQAISHLVAADTGQFHASSAAQPDIDRKIWLNPAEVVSLARARAEEQKRARAHLDAISARHLTVYYEELGPGRVADELRRALRFLDRYAHVPNGFRPATIAMDSDRRVANRAEILDHLLAKAPDLLQSLSS